MRQYEAVIIYPLQVAGEKLEHAVKAFGDQLKKQGGSIDGHRDLGKQSFGYRIKKQKEGQYVVYDFQLDPAKVDAFKRALSLTEDILRYTVFVKQNKVSQSTAVPSRPPQKTDAPAPAHTQRQS